MNTTSALTYRFTLAVLLLVAARGLYHTVNIFLDGGVHIRLIDDGIGMNSQMLEKYGTRTTSKSGGSGIGVHLSIKLLQEAGYQIKVQSIEHQGTAIDIYQNGNLDRLRHASRNTKMFC